MADGKDAAGWLVRPAQPSDIDGIATVHGSLFDDAWHPEAIRKMLAAPAIDALVACFAGHVGGFILISCAADEMEVLSIGVARTYQRKGLAGRLLRAAMDRGRQKGAIRVHLEVAAGNASAKAVYEKHGFIAIGVRRAYYALRDGGRADAIMMAKNLSGRPAGPGI